ncbi:MAG: SLC5 family protein [Cyclobacteriaceae bacterium]
MDYLTIIIFIGYFLLILFVGLWVSRKGQNDADDYFLAGRKLPWYAVGLSMIGSNISTEHFIGMVGAAYIFGISPANYDQTAFFSMTLMIFIFLPYYFRNKLYTIPQFLERRFNKNTRTIFAILTIFHMVLVLLAGALYAGGLIFQEIFSPEGVLLSASGKISSSLVLGILVIAITTGIYSIYGGLTSVVWTDVLQTIILIFAGFFVTIIALKNAGGWNAMWEVNQAAGEERVHLIQSSMDSFAPWPGIMALFLTLGVWYNCTNQFYIQRCFGARSEWDSRMGIVLAGAIKQFLPLIIVIPGIIAFSIYGKDVPQDKVFLLMLNDLLPPFLKSLVLTGLAAAIMSTVSSLLNSSSTVFTIDIYQQYINPNADQPYLLKIGRWSTFFILLAAIVWAPFILHFGEGLFVYIQDMASYFAPSIAAIFLVGILWRRMSASAANVTLVGGIFIGIGLKLLSGIMHGSIGQFIQPFLNRALVNWVLCLLLIVSISLLSKKRNLPSDIIWKPSYSKLPIEERKKFTGWKSFYLWWGVVLIVRIIIYFIYG